MSKLTNFEHYFGTPKKLSMALIDWTGSCMTVQTHTCKCKLFTSRAKFERWLKEEADV